MDQLWFAIYIICLIREPERTNLGSLGESGSKMDTTRGTQRWWTRPTSNVQRGGDGQRREMAAAQFGQRQDSAAAQSDDEGNENPAPFVKSATLGLCDFDCYGNPVGLDEDESDKKDDESEDSESGESSGQRDESAAAQSGQRTLAAAAQASDGALHDNSIKTHVSMDASADALGTTIRNSSVNSDEDMSSTFASCSDQDKN